MSGTYLYFCINYHNNKLMLTQKTQINRKEIYKKNKIAIFYNLTTPIKGHFFQQLMDAIYTYLHTCLEIDVTQTLSCLLCFWRASYLQFRFASKSRKLE